MSMYLSTHLSIRQKKTILAAMVLAMLLVLPFASAIQISNVRTVDITDTRAAVAWDTDEPADSFVFYGTAPESLQAAGDARAVQEHRLALESLQPSTEYLYRVESGNVRDDNSGNYYSFTTQAPDVTAPSLNVELPAIIQGDRLDIRGTTEAGARVDLFINGALSASTAASLTGEEPAGEEDESEEEPSEPSGSFLFPAVQLQSNHANAINITATDRSGNQGSVASVIIADTSAPELILTPVANVSGSATLALNGTVSENSSISISVNERVVEEIQGTQFAVQLRLDEGSNAIVIRAVDAAGWEAVYAFTVIADTRAPTVRFELEQGNEFYEGRAETAINGETEADAKVYLFVFRQDMDLDRRQFSRAITSTTADAEGKFRFSDVEFPPTLFSGWEELGPREVPPGLAEIVTSPVERIAQQDRRGYKVIIIAEDLTGKSGYAQKVVNVNTCFSGEYAFDVSPHPDFPNMPFRLDPGLMEEGREQIQALFEVRYRGDGQASVNPRTGQEEQGYRLDTVYVEKACTRQMSETDDYALGCRLLPGQRLNSRANQDNTALFISSSLNPAREFLEVEDDPWEDFVSKRQLKFPLKIMISYRERNADGGWSEQKRQPFCYDLGYFVDRPIASEDLVPDFLADEGVDALNYTITQIETIKPYLEKAVIISGVSCVGSWLTKTLGRFYRLFISKFEPWLTKVSSTESTCPKGAKQYELYPQSTIDHWRKLKTDYPQDKIEPENKFLNSDWNWLGDPEQEKEHSLEEKCPQTAAAWKAEEYIDKLFQFTCDRFLCRPVPARWTENANEEQVNKIKQEELNCPSTANCGAIREVENCQEEYRKNPAKKTWLAVKTETEPTFPCYLDPATGVYYERPSDVDADSMGIIKLTPMDEQPLRLQEKSRASLFAYKEQGSDQFCVAQDITCDARCRRKQGYRAATDGFGGKASSVLQRLVSPVATFDGKAIYIDKDKKLFYDDGASVSDTDAKTIRNLEDYKKNVENATQQILKQESGPRYIPAAPVRSTDNGCYKEAEAGGNKQLQNKEGNPLQEGKIAAGYTKDCFVDPADPDGGRFQCVCEATAQADNKPKDIARTALQRDTATGSFEEYSFQQDMVYKESGKSYGTYYPEWRYYAGRDFSGAFGLNWGFDNFKSNENVNQMSVTQVNPHSQYISTFQTMCLRGILARLTMLQSTLIGLRNCIIEAKYTGLQDAGMCKTIFTQYVCGLIYKGISYFTNQCTPSSLDDVGKGGDFSSAGIKEFFDAGFSAVPNALQSSIDEVNDKYNDANFRQFFATGAQGFSESLCLAAFGYDFPLGMDFIEDTAYSFSTEITAIFPIAERELATFDPVRGTAIHNYHVGGTMFPGCKIRGYRTYLKCVGPEDLGHPGVDRSCLGQGCDCLNAPESRPELAGERQHLLQDGASFGGVPRGQVYDFPLPSPQRVSSNFRYDHVVLEITLDQFESKDTCFPQGYQTAVGGKFYFPIRDISPPVSVNCYADPTSGRFICPQIRGIFGGGNSYFEHPFVQCYDKREDEFYNCENHNVVLADDNLVIKPYLYLDGGERACLRIKDSRGSIEQTIPLPESHTGPFSPRLDLGKIPAEVIRGGGFGSITNAAGSDPGCGGDAGRVKVLLSPTADQNTQAKNVRFDYFPQEGGQYKVRVADGVTVEPNNGYSKDTNGFLTLNGNNMLTAEQANTAIFAVNGFRFSQVLGTPTPQNPQSGACIYTLNPPRVSGSAANIGSMTLMFQLLKPGPNEHCYNTQTIMPRGNFGQPTHTQPIRVQQQLEQVAAASGLQADFSQGRYDRVIGAASTMMDAEEATLNEAIGIYYYVASLVVQGTQQRQAEINVLLRQFLERKFQERTLQDFSPEVKSSLEYQKIHAYLCEVDKSVNSAERGKFSSYCGGGS